MLLRLLALLAVLLPAPAGAFCERDGQAPAGGACTTDRGLPWVGQGRMDWRNDWRDLAWRVDDLLGGVPLNAQDPQFAGGAKGDGIADDGPALQAALDATGAAGQCLTIPAGTYRITTGALKLKYDRQCVVGVGPQTVIVQETEGAGCIANGSQPLVQLAELRLGGLRCDCGGTTTCSVAFDLSAVADSVLDDLEVSREFGGGGGVAYGYTTCAQLLSPDNGRAALRNVAHNFRCRTREHATAVGLVIGDGITSANANLFLGGNIQADTGTDVIIKASNGNRIDGIVFEGSANSGVEVRGNLTEQDANIVAFNRFEGPFVGGTITFDATSGGNMALGNYHSGTGSTRDLGAANTIMDARPPGLHTPGLVDVRAFGAKGDGVTDDTAAIRDALDHVGAQVLRFSAGTYIVRPDLTLGSRKYAFALRSDLHLRGDGGAVLKIADGVSSNAAPVHFAMFLGNAAIQRVSFDGLIFDGNGAANPHNGSQFNQAFVQLVGAGRADDVTIDRCVFQNNAGMNNVVMGDPAAPTLGRRWTVRSTVHLDGALDAPDFTAIYAWADDVEVTGSRFVQSTAPTVWNGKNARNAIELHGSNSKAVDNVTRNYLNGVYIYGNTVSEQRNVLVQGNTFDAAFLGGVRIARDTASILPMSGIDVLDNQTTLTTAAYSTSGTYKHGVLIDSEYGITDVLIARNRLVAPAGMANVSAGVNFAGGVTPAAGAFDRLSIRDNSVVGAYNAVRIFATTGTEGIGALDVRGNTAWNLSDATGNTTPIAYYVRGEAPIQRATLDENQVLDDRVTPQTDYGVWVQATVKAKLRRSRFRGVATPITVAGGATLRVDPLDISEFGAEGDDATDNSTVVDTLLTTCEALGGCKIIVPCGTWRSHTWNLPSNVEVAGAGWCAVLKHTGIGRSVAAYSNCTPTANETTLSMFRNKNHDCGDQNISLHDFKVDMSLVGPPSGSDNLGTNFGAVNNVNISRVYWFDLPQDGVHFRNGWGHVVDANVFDGCNMRWGNGSCVNYEVHTDANHYAPDPVVVTNSTFINDGPAFCQTKSCTTAADCAPGGTCTGNLCSNPLASACDDNADCGTGACVGSGNAISANAIDAGTAPASVVATNNTIRLASYRVGVRSLFAAGSKITGNDIRAVPTRGAGHGLDYCMRGIDAIYTAGTRPPNRDTIIAHNVIVGDTRCAPLSRIEQVRQQGGILVIGDEATSAAFHVTGNVIRDFKGVAGEAGLYVRGTLGATVIGNTVANIQDMDAAVRFGSSTEPEVNLNAAANTIGPTTGSATDAYQLQNVTSSRIDGTTFVQPLGGLRFAYVGTNAVQVPTINVRDYGATGDGTTDDTVALQAAATACEAAGGGTIYAPKGTYLASQWTIGSGCTLQGDGIDVTTFLCAATEANLCIFGSAGGDKAIAGSNYGTAVTNVAFQDFTLDGNDVNRHAGFPTCNGATCYVRGLGTAHESRGVHVQRVRVVRGGSRALEFAFTSDLWVQDSIVDDSSHVSGREGDCIHVDTECTAGHPRNPPNYCTAGTGMKRVENIWIERNLIRRCGDVGIEASLSDHVHILNNTHLGWGVYGSMPPPLNAENGIHCSGCVDADISGNILRGIEAPGIGLSYRDWFTPVMSPRSIRITNNTLSFAAADRGLSAVGISVTGHATAPATDIAITGNTVENAVRQSIRATTQVYDLRIDENIILNANTLDDGTADDDAAILVSYTTGSPADRYTITNNRISAATNRMRWGIAQLWTAGAGPNLVAGNTVTGAVEGALKLATPGTVAHQAPGIKQAHLTTAAVLTGAKAGSRVWCEDCKPGVKCPGAGTGAFADKKADGWWCGEADVAYVERYGAACDGAANDSAAVQAAIDSGLPVVEFPAGKTCLMCQVVMRSSHQVLRGESTTATVSGTTGCSNVLVNTGGPAAEKVTISRLTLKSSPGLTAMVNLTGSWIKDVTIDGVVCDLRNGGYCAVAQRLNNWVFRDSEIYGDWGQNQSHAALIQRGGSIVFDRNRIEGTYNGVIVDVVGQKDLSVIHYTNNRADMGWTVRQPRTWTDCAGPGKATCSDSGAGVSYTATTLTDTDANFPAVGSNNATNIITQSTLRALLPRLSGTITVFSGTYVGDGAANFATAGVKKHDLVYTATAFATVKDGGHDNTSCASNGVPWECCTNANAGTCEQRVWIDGWRSRQAADYGRPVVAPSIATAYTIYRPLYAHVTSGTATSLTATTTSAGWRDAFGVAVTPPDGSLYEISSNKPNYLLSVEGTEDEAKAVDVYVAGNYHRRGWADQFSIFTSDAQVFGNIAEDGQDGGITISGNRNLVTNNVARHNGGAGFWVWGNQNKLIGNAGLDNRWTNSVCSTCGSEFDLNTAVGNDFQDNIARRLDTGLTQSLYGISVRDAASKDNRFVGTRFGGHVTAEVYLDASTSGTMLSRSRGLTLAAGSGARATLDETPMSFGADPSGTADSAPAFNAWSTAAALVGSSLLQVPAGKFLLNSPWAPASPANNDVGIIGLTIQGAGKGNTQLMTATTGDGYALIRTAYPKTCTGGTGPCDARYWTKGRGAGCVCVTNHDCQSAVCAAAPAQQRNFRIADLGLALRTDDSEGLNLTNFSSTEVESVQITGVGKLNTTGIVLSDGGAGVGKCAGGANGGLPCNGNGNCPSSTCDTTGIFPSTGYYNVLRDLNIHDTDIAVRMMPQANATEITGSLFGNSNGSGIVMEPGVVSTWIHGNTFQSNRTPVCTANACVGGFWHGAACTTAADCREAGVIALGNDPHVEGNYFENMATHQLLGCEPTTGHVLCFARRPVIDGVIGPNRHSGSSEAWVNPWSLNPTTPPTVRDRLTGSDIGPPQRSARQYGAWADGTHDDAPAIQTAINDICSQYPTTGGVVRLPAGTYKLGSSITIGAGSAYPCDYLTLEGDGAGSTVLDCSAIIGDCVTSGTLRNRFTTVRGMTFKGPATGGSTPNLLKVRRVDENVRVERVDFQVTTGNGLLCDGCTGLDVEGGTFYGDGDIQTGEFPRGIYVGGTANGVRVHGSRFDYLGDDVYLVGSATSPLRNIVVDATLHDGGWWTQKPRYTNAGGTVSYTATTLVDSSAPFAASGVPVFNAIKVLSTLATGTVTSTAGGLTDSGASFSTAIKRGDEIRTATAFAIVEQRLSGTAIATTGWRALSDRRPVNPPADGTAYTVYGVTLAEAGNSTNTTSTITVFRWFDATGATVATPAATTRYEVLWLTPGYGIKSTVNVNGVQVAGGRFNRTGAAAIELNGDGNTVTGVYCRDGKDGCINFNGSTSTATGNTCDHLGRFCLALVGSGGVGKHTVTGNVAYDGRWTSPGTPPTYTGFPIVILSSDQNVVVGNTLTKGALVAPSTVLYGIYLDDYLAGGDKATGNYIAGNQVTGFDAVGIKLQDADVVGTMLGDTVGATVSDGGMNTQRGAAALTMSAKDYVTGGAGTLDSPWTFDAQALFGTNLLLGENTFSNLTTADTVQGTQMGATGRWASDGASWWTLIGATVEKDVAANPLTGEASADRITLPGAFSSPYMLQNVNGICRTAPGVSSGSIACAPTGTPASGRIGKAAADYSCKTNCTLNCPVDTVCGYPVVSGLPTDLTGRTFTAGVWLKRVSGSSTINLRMGLSGLSDSKTVACPVTTDWSWCTATATFAESTTKRCADETTACTQDSQCAGIGDGLCKPGCGVGKTCNGLQWIVSRSGTAAADDVLLIANASVNEGPAPTTLTPRHITFGAGHWKLPAQDLAVPSRTTIAGTNRTASVLHCDPATPTACLSLQPMGQGLSMSNLTLDVQGTARLTGAVYGGYARGIYGQLPVEGLRLTDVTFTNGAQRTLDWYGGDVDIRGCYSTDTSRLRTCNWGTNSCGGAIGTWGAGCACTLSTDCQAASCGKEGDAFHVETRGGRGVRMIGNTADRSGDTGFACDYGDGCTLIGNTVRGSAHFADPTQGYDESGIDLHGARNVVVQGNTVLGVKQIPIISSGYQLVGGGDEFLPNNILITGNYLSGVPSLSVDYPCVYLRGEPTTGGDARDVVVTNNVLESCGQAGVRAANNIKGLTIAGNTIIDPWVGGTPGTATQGGIVIADAVNNDLDQVAVYGNTLRETRGTPLMVSGVVLRNITGSVYRAGRNFFMGAGALANPYYLVTGSGNPPIVDDYAEINVKDFGARGDGATDDRAALQAALDAGAASGAPVSVPCGRYRIAAALLLKNYAGVPATVNQKGQVLRGAGACSIIESDTAGTGFTMLRSGLTSRTCTGGTGNCDARLGRSARGAGCYCQTLSDCQSGVCAAGSETDIKGAAVVDLAFVMRKDNMVAVDALGINESAFERLAITTEDGLAHTNTVGMVFTDGDPAKSGYSNTVFDSRVLQSDVCIWMRNQGNDTRLISNAIKQGATSGCGTGIVAESVTGASITQNLLQTTKAPVCGSPCTALTCCGGYHHGATCATAADCAEADIITHNITGSGTESGTRIIANRIEDSNNVHIRVGCTAVAGGPCSGGGDSATPYIVGNYHGGTGAPVLRTNVNSAFPAVILEATGTSGPTAGLVNMLGRAPLQLPPRAEPLPACVAGVVTGSEGAVVYNESKSPKQFCMCTSAAVWCPLNNVSCSGGTSTTCGS